MGQKTAPPKFKRIGCGTVKGLTNPKEYDLCIEVDYPTDKKDDTMLLNMVKKEITIFKGKLFKEGTRVAVTITDAKDPDKIEVIFLSTYSDPFKSHFTNF